MSEKYFFPAYLDGLHWKLVGSSYPTFDGAVQAVMEHSSRLPTTDPIQSAMKREPDLECRIYRSDNNPLNAAIVEIGPNAKTPMMALSFYKIIEGQFSPASVSDYESAYAKFSELQHEASDTMIKAGDAMKLGNIQAYTELVAKASQLNDQANALMAPFMQKN